MHYRLWNHWYATEILFSVCEGRSASDSGVGSAYHLSQAIADGKLGEDKSFTAVILEARDFCKFLEHILFSFLV
jgi:hypothetical protein